MPVETETPALVVDTPAVDVPAVVADVPADTPAVEPAAAPAVEEAAAPDTVVADVPDWMKSWAGDMEAIPEDNRPMAKAVSDHYQKIITDQESMLKTFEAFVLEEEQSGKHPELATLRAEIEQHKTDLAQRQVDLDAALAGSTDWESKYTTQNTAIEAREQELLEDQTKDFARRHPKLVTPGTKESKRMQEILADEGDEDLWDVRDLPALVDMDAKTYKKVKKLVQEGVPPKHAIEFTKQAVEEVAKFPVDAVAGATNPGSRPTSPTKTTEGQGLDAAIDRVAGNAILKMRR